MSKTYQICSRCIMDTTDSEITFDKNGVCNHCKKYEQIAKNELHLNIEGQKKLKKIIEKIKQSGTNKQYNCIIGVSGGVDSTYVAYIVKKLGLRPLAVHLDNGWNSELAVSNIEKTLKKLDIDLYTQVLDWEEFKSLQIAFLKASTPDSEIPTDHAIVATLYKIAAQMNIKYLIWGTNVVTESILPRTWSAGHDDWKYIKNINKIFGIKKLKHFPHYSLLSLFYYKILKRQTSVSILNYFDYKKDQAMKILEHELGWKYYGGKHYESIYTRFFQGYILPTKFGYDKRKGHLSTLINSKQLTRDEAIAKLKEEKYPTNLISEDKLFVLKKLGLSNDEFENIMSLPKRSYWDYPSHEKNPFFKYIKILYIFLKQIKFL